MSSLAHLLENNRAWSERLRRDDPQFFAKLSAQQQPRYLWIGCADSRVPATEIVDLAPGEMFVHRNLANVVAQSDLNCMSVVQFAVDVLRVEHIIVCGHYGCKGVAATFEGRRIGIADNWLRPIQDILRAHEADLARMGSASERVDRLCEFNVLEQVANVCRTTVVTAAWARGQPLAVHGWIYGLHDGRIRDLQVTASAGPSTT